MPLYRIAIANRQRALHIDRRALVALGRRVLALEQVAGAEISVAIVNDAAIHDVNREFLNHDYPTDVISFSLSDDAARIALPTNRPRGTQQAIRRGAGRMIDGEVVISAETALRNAANRSIKPERELELYLVHGLLHLCGYDDLTPREKRLMRRREAEVLKFGGKTKTTSG